jgi:hypothetical protein
MATDMIAVLAEAPHGPRPNMQIHLKAYLQLISRLWHFRVLLPRNRDPAARDASPLLIYIVAVLVLLLSVLEVDLHRALLQSFGLLGDPVGINSIFMSP